MRNHARLWLILVLILTTPFATSLFQPADEGGKEQESVFPELSGPYLGQEPPGMEPVLFAPGLVSTAWSEGCVAFSDEGRYFIFNRFLGEGKIEVLWTAEKAGKWLPFQNIDWASEFGLGDFTLAPGGQTLLFAANRATTGGMEAERANIFISRKEGFEWSKPEEPEGINTPEHESYPSAAADGTLYFFSRKPGGKGQSDLYYSKLVDGKYTEPVNIEILNTEAHEWDPFIAPDQSYLIYCSMKPGGLGRDDFYISFRRDDGSWAEGIHMGDKINSPHSENRPFVTFDGKYFFFTSNKPSDDPALQQIAPELRPGNGQRDVYWVDARIIDRFRK